MMPPSDNPLPSVETAWKRSLIAPDPPGLDRIVGNNRVRLRAVAKFIDQLCLGRIGTDFYLGSIHAGDFFGAHNYQFLRWLTALERQGVIRRTWIGRPCQRDVKGDLNTRSGAFVNRASEYVYLGMPSTR